MTQDRSIEHPSPRPIRLVLCRGVAEDERVRVNVPKMLFDAAVVFDDEVTVRARRVEHRGTRECLERCNRVVDLLEGFRGCRTTLSEVGEGG